MVFSYNTFDAPAEALDATEKKQIPNELAQLSAFASELAYISQISAQFQFILNS